MPCVTFPRAPIKVAIIIPVFNVENYLEQCLDSILSQTFKDFLIIAIDDGSTDSSAKILDKYCSKDPRLHIIQQKNQGVSSARNAGLDFIEKRSDIEFVYFLDADDYIATNFLETAITDITTYNADYFVCGYERFDQNGILSRYYDESPSKSIITQQKIGLQFFKEPEKRLGFRDKTVGRFLNNKVFRLSKIKNVRFNNDFRCMEDVDFFLRCLPKIHNGILNPSVLFFYRLRKSSLSQTALFNDDKLQLFSKIYIEGDYPDFVKNGVEKCLLDSFWGVTQYVYLGKSHRFSKKSLQNLYDQLSKTDIFDRASPRNRRRFFLYKLGDTTLKTYFYLKSKSSKDHSKKTSSFFP